MFPCWVTVYHHLVSDRVVVVYARGVFSFVVLDDKLLLSFLDILPVGFERYIQYRIAIEHQLRRRGTRCGVNGATDCMPYGGQNSSPSVVTEIPGVIESHAADLVVNHLVDTFDD